MRKLILVGLLSIYGQVAAESSNTPFGLSMGTSGHALIKMGAVYYEKSDVYFLTTPPIANSSFENLTMIVSPKYGLCKILAVTKDLVGGDSKSMRPLFENLYDALKSKYGIDTDQYDAIDVDSKWKEDKDFTMSLHEGDRALSAYWLTIDGAKLYNDIDAIGLEANGLTATTGYISLTYQFKNYSKCKAERDAASKQGL